MGENWKDHTVRVLEKERNMLMERKMELEKNPVIVEWQEVLAQIQVNDDAIVQHRRLPIPSHAFQLTPKLRTRAKKDGERIKDRGRVLGKYKNIVIYENPYREILENDEFTGPDASKILDVYGFASRSVTPAYIGFMMDKKVIERLGWEKPKGRGRASYKYRTKRVRTTSLSLNDASDAEKQHFVASLQQERELQNNG